MYADVVACFSTLIVAAARGDSAPTLPWTAALRTDHLSEMTGIKCDPSLTAFHCCPKRLHSGMCSLDSSRSDSAFRGEVRGRPGQNAGELQTGDAAPNKVLTCFAADSFSEDPSISALFWTGLTAFPTGPFSDRRSSRLTVPASRATSCAGHKPWRNSATERTQKGDSAMKRFLVGSVLAMTIAAGPLGAQQVDNAVSVPMTFPRLTGQERTGGINWVVRSERFTPVMATPQLLVIGRGRQVIDMPVDNETIARSYGSRFRQRLRVSGEKANP
jgi:hypothetical protein